MDIGDYRQSLINASSLRATIENDFLSTAMLAELTEALEDSGEFSEPTVLHFEGYGSRNRRLRLDGYSFDVSDGTTSLIVYETGADLSDMPTILASDARKTLAALKNFLVESLDGKFLQDREESSEPYQVAVDIKRRGASTNRYRLYLLTDMRLGGRATSITNEEVSGTPVEYHLWDIDRFHQLQESLGARAALDIDLTTWLPSGLPALRFVGENDQFTTYLAALPGSLLADLYQEYGSRLLESNVRSFLSTKGKVNKGIRTTVLSEPSMFLAYNNGVTATATHVKTSNDISSAPCINSIRDLQIVNGGQTTASLFYTRRDTKDVDLGSVYVQMKLVVVDPSTAEDVVPNISRYANSQNKVSEVDFFSSSPFHVRLEDISRRILAPAVAGVHVQTKWFYERTRGQYQSERSRLTKAAQKRFDAEFPRNQVVTKTDAAKYAVCFSMKPHVVSSGAQKNFVVFADEVSKIWSSEPDLINELYFKRLVAMGIVYNSLRREVSRASWYEKGYLANIVAYTISKIVHDIARQFSGSQLDLLRIWTAQDIDDVFREEGLRIAHRVLGVLTSSNRPVQNVTEWAKKEACWEQVRELDLVLNPAFRNQLEAKSQAVSKEREARRAQKVDSGIMAQVQVMEVPDTTWRAVKDLAVQRSFGTAKELSIVQKKVSGTIPSELQSKVLLELLERARSFGLRE